MDEETKDVIKQVATGVVIVGLYAGIVYGSYKMFAGMVAGSVVQKLLKEGVVLAAVVA